MFYVYYYYKVIVLKESLNQRNRRRVWYQCTMKAIVGYGKGCMTTHTYLVGWWSWQLCSACPPAILPALVFRPCPFCGLILGFSTRRNGGRSAFGFIWMAALILCIMATPMLWGKPRRWGMSWWWVLWVMRRSLPIRVHPFYRWKKGLYMCAFLFILV